MGAGPGGRVEPGAATGGPLRTLDRWPSLAAQAAMVILAV